MTNAVCDHDSLPFESEEELFVTPAELRCLREFLGLPPVWLADRLKVRERTLHRWEAAVAPIPDGVATEVENLANDAADIVEQLVQQYEASGGGELVTYRTDEDYRAVGELGLVYPASWHRAIAARVAEQVPDVTLVYFGENLDS
ncbi:hypothetical protein [Mycolicibacterium sp.]|uniref:hypothetical protein n=1 Tax=Mycolicibacterium sp. TaxID=2320850 RepID=UPI0037CA87DE